mmetsp:Transcript_1360/g.3948  ORF Transcript_1360/g.3948 Transcript_1360/m.3948 type:complete len:782 (-) Transcript_1360:100-2445(-)
MAPCPRPPRAQVVLGGLVLLVRSSHCKLVAWSAVQRVPPGPPVRLPAEDLDGESLLQTHFGVERGGAGEGNDGLSLHLPDKHFQLLVERAQMLKNEGAEPWFHNFAMDTPWLGLHQDRGLSWSESFQQWDSVLHESKEDALATVKRNFTVRFVEEKHDPGSVFQKVKKPDAEDQFALQTIFGTYISREPDGTVYHNRTRLSAETWFKVKRHPNVPKQGQCVVAVAAANLCLGVKNMAKELATIFPSATKTSTIFKVTERNGTMMLESGWGWVTASLSTEATREWRKPWHNWPYEMQQIIQKEGLRVEVGWAKGLICGLYLGGFLVLVTYNVQFFVRNPSASPPSRLPNFDVARFVLETLVVHVHLGLIGLARNNIGLWISSYRMPSFMFIAGVFGSSMQYESVARVVCCTAGTIILMMCVRLCEYAIFVGPDKVRESVTPYPDISVNLAHLWFLAALLFCRVLVTPLFYFARKLRVRPLVALAVVKSASFLLMTWSASWTIPVFGMYNWSNALNFAPYFALGLLFSPKEWDEIFERQTVKLACIAYFVAWYLLTLVPPFLAFNKMYCLPRLQARGCKTHFDPEQMTPGATIERFLLDWVMYLLRAGITVSAVGVVYALCGVVKPRAPKVIEFTAGWGSRTLFTYVLHLHMFTSMAVMGNVVDVFWSLGGTGKLFASLIMPLLINIVLSSKGTEHLFKWLLMPFWMKDILESQLSLKPGTPKRPARPEGGPGEQRPLQDLSEIEKPLSEHPKAEAASSDLQPPQQEVPGAAEASLDGQPHKV